MINLHSPVTRGKIVNQDGQFAISEMIVRGGEHVVVKATGTQDGEELPGGMEMDLPSLIDFCKRVLIETGTLSKWFFIGVVVDANHSQLRTYFSPSKEIFFSDIYNYIKEDLLENLPMADTETVVKNFFENNLDFHFDYIIIPLDTLLSGSIGGKLAHTDIRI